MLFIHSLLWKYSYFYQMVPIINKIAQQIKFYLTNVDNLSIDGIGSVFIKPVTQQLYPYRHKITQESPYPQKMSTNIATKTSYSQKRAKQLLEHHEQIARMFQINNFYDNNHINVEKLKEKIGDAKRKLLIERDQHTEKEMKGKGVSVRDVEDEIGQYRDFVINYQHHQQNGNNGHNVKNKKQKERQRAITRATEHRSKIPHQQKNPKQSRLVRIATDLGQYSLNRNHSSVHHHNLSSDEPPSRTRAKLNQSRHLRMLTVESPSAQHQYSRSVLSTQIQHRKIVLGHREQVKEFEMKVAVLWELYECIVGLMQQIGKNGTLDEELVLEYVRHVSGEKYQFVHEMCELFSEMRVERSIRMCRILENFSVFEMCLSSLPKNKTNPSQIINYLGYSSSSAIFLIKILLLTHQTSFTYSQHITTIIDSIIKFEISSYKAQIRNIKDVLRRLEHNNEIIGMIKGRCGKRHGRYCEEFISKMVKGVEKFRMPFYECANNIFEFLAFYLHHENISGYLPLLATPPSPFLSLAYSKTIIIDPWCVLATRKNNKLVIRAHTGKFLAQISDSCNLIFWTEMMPKDAEILTDLFPVKQNVYWLYRYHCRQTNDTMVKLIDLVGCITENTIVIDSMPEHYGFNQDIGFTMFWRGERRDTKLLGLSEILQEMFAEAGKNKTTLKVELEKMRPEIQQLKAVKRVNISRQVKFKHRS